MKLLFATFITLIHFFCLGENVLLRTPPENFKMKAEVVAILPFLADKVLLLQRSPTHSQANLWVCPGGKVDPGETLLEASVRELYEETGIQAEGEELIPLGSFYVRYPNGDFLFHLYKLDVKDPKQITLVPREHQNSCICSIDEALQLPLSPGMDECLYLGSVPLLEDIQNLAYPYKTPPPGCKD